MDDWTINARGYGCVKFLEEYNLIEMVEHNKFKEGIVDKCVAYNVDVSFKDINEIKNEDDIKQLMFITGEFQDARMAEMNEKEDGSLVVNTPRFTTISTTKR